MFGRPLHFTSAAAALLVALALLAAVKQLPGSLRKAQAQISTNAARSLQERELAPAAANEVNQGLAVRAAEVMPRNAVFYVATASGAGSAAAAPFYAYWLLPRRHTSDLANANWIINYGLDATKLGVKFDVVLDLGAGAQVLRVHR